MKLIVNNNTTLTVPNYLNIDDETIYKYYENGGEVDEDDMAHTFLYLKRIEKWLHEVISEKIVSVEIESYGFEIMDEVGLMVY